MAIAHQIIEIAVESDVQPDVALGFFTTLDWSEMADGRLRLDEIYAAVKYADAIHQQYLAGVRVIDGGRQGDGEASSRSRK